MNAVLKKAPPLQLPLWAPRSTWRPPAELPDLKAWDPKTIAVDVETRDPFIGEGLGPGVRRGSYIVGLSLGIDQGPRYYFPIRHEPGGNMDPELVMRWARDNFNAFRGRVVGANIGYDLDFLAEEGVTFAQAAGFDDVILAEPLLDEHKRGHYNLDDISKEHLGVGKDQGHLAALALSFGWKTKNEIKSNLWRLHGHDAGEYGEADADRPLRILPVQRAKLEADEQWQCYELERRLIPMFVAMRRRGVPVSYERAEHADRVLTREIQKWDAQVKRLAGPKAEFNAADSLAPALRERGIHPGMTGGGVRLKPKPQINKEFLEKNQGDELVDAIAAARRVFTLKNTFIDGHVGTHAIDGRIHCTFKQTLSDTGGTVGARLASSDPNMQNIPARESEWDDMIDMGGADVVKLIRGIFVPEQGERWQSNDYSQIEYRLLVHFAVGAGAEEARQKYRDDPKTDFHKFCATLLGVDPEDKVRRKRVKNTNFAKGYGAQYRKLATTFNCSEEEAREFVEEYDREIPFSKATLEAAARWVQKRGYVETILKRKQRFPFWVPARNKYEMGLRREAAEKKWPGQFLVRAKDYVGLNRKLQSSAGEIIKVAMANAWESGVCAPDALGPLYLQVHDELNSSVPRTKRGDEAGRELVRLMGEAVQLKVPVVAEMERGLSWGECHRPDDPKMAAELKEFLYGDLP